MAQLHHGQRALEVLPATFLGQDVPYPLGACQGNCVHDNDCVAGLQCNSRSPGDIVRGCSLTLELLFSSVNFCVLDAAHQPVQAPTSSGNDKPSAEIIPTLSSAPVNIPTPVILPTPVTLPTPVISSSIDAVYIGNGVNVNLGLCEGDCDADMDCAPGLICFQRSAGQGIPGCTLSPDLAASDFDFCYDPSPPSPTVVGPPTLTPAEFVGNGVNQNLGLCRGDCDADSNCAGDLICFQRSEGDEVPGCSLSADLLVSSFDFCTDPSFTFAPVLSPVGGNIIPTAPSPVPPPVQLPVPTPVLMPVLVPTPIQMPVPTPAQMPVPTPVSMPVPTPIQGPVTTPAQMPVPTPIQAPATSPIQMPVPTPVQAPATNPIQMPVPTPVQAPVPSSPIVSPPVALPTVVFPPTPHPTRTRSIDWSAPTSRPTRPRSVDGHQPIAAKLISNVDNASLGICEGDCDRDSHCARGLICYHRERGDSMPSCLLSAELKNTNIDFCIPDPQFAAAGWVGNEISEGVGSEATFTAASNSEPFALKLYWEEGYYWQYESYERKWCVGCRGSCNPGNDVAVYNCDESREMWTFVEYDDGSAQIQNYNWELCLESAGSDQIMLAVCDATVMEQRFVALGGSFDHYRFELSPLMKPGLCLTQDHHPKMNEILILDPCSKARRDTTSFWNKY